MRNILDFFKKSENLVLLFIFLLPFLFYFNWFQHFQDSIWTYGDGEYSYFSYRKFMVDSWFAGKLPLWNSFINLGMPLHSDPQAELFYPLNSLFLFFPFNVGFNLLMMIHFSLAGIFTYLYLRAVNFSRFSAILGAIAFSFCGAINTRRGHVSVEYTLVWLPFIFYAYEKLRRTKDLKYLGILTIAIALQFYAGFTQAFLYSIIALALYMGGSFIKCENKIRWTKEVVLIGVLTFLLIAAQFIPTIMTAVDVKRNHLSYDIFASYSLPIKHLLGLLNPFFFGSHFPGTPIPLFTKPYWGVDSLTEYALYVGLFPLIFGISTFRDFKKSNFVKYWLAIAIISLIFALGGNVPIFYHLIYKIPFLNSFRVPARILFVFDFAICVLFAYAINQIQIENKFEESLKWVNRIIFALMVIVSAYMINTNLYVITDRELIIPLILSFIAFMVIEFSLLNLINTKMAFKFIFGGFLFIDLWFFGFFNCNIFAQIKAESALASTIKKIDPTNEFRILTIGGLNGDLSYDLVSRDRNMAQKIRSLTGHTTFIPAVFMEALRCDEAGTFIDYDYFIRNRDLLSALNTRWIILNNTDKSQIRYKDVAKTYSLVASEGNYDIFDNSQAQKIIFSPRKIIYTESNVIDGFNYTESIILKDQTMVTDNNPNTYISDIQIDNGEISAVLKSDKPAFVAVSETYNKFWKAFLNNTKVTIHQVNGLTLGFLKPAGEFKLSLIYYPTHLFVSGLVSLFTLIAVVFLILFSRKLPFLKK